MSSGFLVEEAVAAPQTGHLVANQAEKGRTQHGALYEALGNAANKQIHVVDVVVDPPHLVYHLCARQAFIVRPITHKHIFNIIPARQSRPRDPPTAGLSAGRKVPCSRCKVAIRAAINRKSQNQ